MPEGLAAAVAVPGFPWIAAATLLAGLVYGFAGFGAGLVGLPVAARFLPPEDAVAAFSIASWAAAATVLPRVWPQSDRRATGWMILSAVLALPIGLVVLTGAPAVPLRWAICGLVAATLGAVMTGWRVRLGAGAAPRLAVGTTAGLIGGATGLIGPVVILLSLASDEAMARMRANLASFLAVTGMAFPLVIWSQGALSGRAAWLGLALLPVFGIGTALGSTLFRPGLEPFHRRLAYGVVASAAVTGLPLWDG